MALINFITETYLRETSVNISNVDAKDLAPNIEYAQDVYIQPILGSQFYNSLQLSYSAQTLNSNEQNLVLLIKPCLAYYTMYESVPFLTYQIKNKGPQSQRGDNSDSVGMPEMNFLRNNLKNRSEFYAERIQNYLMYNGNLFPDYITQAINQDMLPETEGYDPGFGTYDSWGLFGNCSNCNNSFNGFYRTFR